MADHGAKSDKKGASKGGDPKNSERSSTPQQDRKGDAAAKHNPPAKKVEKEKRSKKHSGKDKKEKRESRHKKEKKARDGELPKCQIHLIGTLLTVSVPFVMSKVSMALVRRHCSSSCNCRIATCRRSTTQTY